MKSAIAILVALYPLAAQTDPSTIQVRIQSDPSTIPLRVGMPRFESPTDAMIRAQQLRRLRLENDALQRDADTRQEAVGTHPVESVNALPAPAPPVVHGLSAPAEDQTTLGFMNGRAWKTASTDMRLSYMVGMAEATVLAKADIFRYFAKGLKATEDAMAVDKFYEDPGNLPVPVLFAMQIVAMKANGEAPDSVENFTATLKRMILEVPK